MDRFPARRRLARRTLAATAGVLATWLLLGGCAASLESVREEFDAEAPCCASLAEIPRHRLGAEDDQAFDLDGASPLFAFESGRSYFRAFELPASDRPLRVTVSSYIVGDSPSTWYVFYPVVLVLDGRMAPRRTLGPEAFDWHEAGMFETSGWRKKLEAALEVSPAEGDRILVVLTTAELLGRVTPVEMLRTAGGVVAGVPILVPTGTRLEAVPNAPMGQVRVRTEPVGGR